MTDLQSKTDALLDLKFIEKHIEEDKYIPEMLHELCSLYGYISDRLPEPNKNVVMCKITTKVEEEQGNISCIVEGFGKEDLQEAVDHLDDGYRWFLGVRSKAVLLFHNYIRTEIPIETNNPGKNYKEDH